MIDRGFVMLRRLLLLLALLVAPAAAHAEWHEVGTPHFVVYGNDRPERLKKFAEDLERFDQALRTWRRFPNEPIGKASRLTVYMVSSSDTIGKLIGNNSIAGFYIGRASGPLAFVPRQAADYAGMMSPQVILFHEYTHHMMHSIFAHGAFPRWLSEGWAEFHATANINKDGSVLFGSAPGYRAWGLLSGNPVPLDRILAADTGKLDAAEQDAFYGRSWALTHYLTFEPSRQGQLGIYIREINAGKPAAEAAKTAFGDVKLLHRDLERFLVRRSISGITVAATSFKIGEITTRKLTAGEAATMDVRIQSDRGVDEKTAPGVYAAAKKAAAPYPNDPGAQIVLAEAAYDAGDYAEAEAAADRAIAANAGAIDAHIYKAMARMGAAKAKDDDTHETWRAIRVIIATANKIDPDDPEPLILYYRSFVEARQMPNKSAKDGLYRAFELAPYDNELRVNTAQMLLTDGDPASARILLMPLAYDPHGGGLAQLATRMIADIDKRAKDAPKTEAAPAKPAGG